MIKSKLRKRSNSLINYIQVGTLDEAHAWIPKFDSNYKYSFLKKVYMLIKCLFNGTRFSNNIRFTIGKNYPLFKSHYNDSVVILDDFGKENELFRKHRGYFVIEVK